LFLLSEEIKVKNFDGFAPEPAWMETSETRSLFEDNAYLIHFGEQVNSYMKKF
jgi:hypothetical protein